MQAVQAIVVDPISPGGVNSPHGLILFDGVCVLCSRACRFVSKHDRSGYFRFVPIQLAEGRPLAEQLGIDPQRPDSFAFVAKGLFRLGHFVFESPPPGSVCALQRGARRA